MLGGLTAGLVGAINGWGIGESIKSVAGSADYFSKSLSHTLDYSGKLMSKTVSTSCIILTNQLCSTINDIGKGALITTVGAVSFVLGAAQLNESIAPLNLVSGSLLAIGGTAVLIQQLYKAYASNQQIVITNIKDPHPYFIARKDIFTQIDNALSSTLPVVIYGPAGIGKTEEALAYADKKKTHYSVMWQFRAHDPEKLRKDYLKLAKKLNLEITHTEELKSLRKKIYTYLKETGQSTLLIFDDVKEPLQLPASKIKILITSRSKNVLNSAPTHQYHKSIEIPRFTHEQGAQLLEKVITLPSSKNEHLINQAEGFPGVLEAMGRIEDELPEKLDFSPLKPNNRYKKSVDPYIESLANLDPLALEWLKICSCLKGDSIPKDWLLNWLKQQTPSQEAKTKQILGQLTDRYLLRSSDSFYSISSYLQSEWHTKENYEQTIKFLEEIEKIDPKNWILHSEKIVNDPFFKTLSEIDQIQYLYKLAHKICFSNEQLQRASEYASRCLVLEKDHYDKENDIRLSDTYFLLGKIFYKLDQNIEALKHFQKSLAMRREVHGVNDCSVATCLFYIGNTHQDLNNYQESLKSHRTAREIRGKLFYEDQQEDIALSLHNMGIACSFLGQNKEALNYVQEAIEIRRKLLNNQPHLTLANLLSLQATTLLRLGKTNAAIKSLKEALEIRQKVLGSDPHEDIVYSLNSLGFRFLDLGKLKEAIEYFEEASNMSGTKVNSSSIFNLQHLGTAWANLGNKKKSLEYLNTGLTSLERIGEKNPTILHNFGCLWRTHGHLEKSLDCLNRAFDMQQLLNKGKPHYLTAKILNKLGCVYRDLGLNDNALTHFQQSLDMHNQLSQDTSEDENHADSYHNMARLYHDLGKNREALDYFMQALQIRKEVYDEPNHPKIANTLEYLGKTQLALGYLEKASETQQEAYTIRKTIFGTTSHPRLARSLDALGEIEMKRGRTEKAIDYHQQALRMYKEVLSDQYDPKVAKTLSHLGVAYKQLGKLKAATNYFQKALAMYKKLPNTQTVEINKTEEELAILNQ